MKALLLLMTTLSVNADHAATIREFFNGLDSESMDLVDNFYADDVVFVDPVGEIHGLTPLRQYYAHMYRPVLDIRFDFPTIQVSGNEAFATWRMTFSSKSLKRGRPITVDGVSHIRFDATGKAIYHRDYFDMGAMVYEHVPLVGFGVRFIKRRLTPTHGESK